MIEKTGNGIKDISSTQKNKVVVRNLTKSFGDLVVLDDISFEIKEGEFFCIVGPTGCGKTTFLNSVTKLYSIDKGDILINNKSINLRKQSLAYIFQEESTMPWLNVEENISFGLKIKNYPRNIIKEQVDNVISMVGLDKYRKYYPKQLSTSMLQRVSIARAFAIKPELLLMDEPYGQLDIELKFKLEDELIKLWEKTSTTALFITHNIEEAVYLGQRILVLTNKPSKVKKIIDVNIPRPRDISAPEFVDLRKEVTELIKWW